MKWHVSIRSNGSQYQSISMSNVHIHDEKYFPKIAWLSPKTMFVGPKQHQHVAPKSQHPHVAKVGSFRISKFCKQDVM